MSSRRELSMWEHALKDAAIRRIKQVEEQRQGEPEKGRKESVEAVCTLLAELGFGDVGYQLQHTLWQLEKAGWQEGSRG